MIRKLRRLVRDDAGMTTAEYAVGTIVPVGLCSWRCVVSLADRRYDPSGATPIGAVHSSSGYPQARSEAWNSQLLG